MRKNRADALVPAMLVLGALLVAIDVVWTFTLAPLVQGAQLSEPVVISGQMVTTKLLLSQKIFYLHVPVAIASFAAMGVAAFYALRLLMTKDRAHDVRSRTAMQITLVFIVATMISGDLWTRFEWGVWWVWEPRLTTYFILMLLVIGYFVLRNALDDPEKAARFAAVFCIIAFVDAPISFLITRLVPSSVHPVVFRTDSGLPPLMLIPFLLGMVGVLMVAFALYRYALRVNTAADEVEDLKRRLEELDGQASRAAAAEALDRLKIRAAGVVLTDGSSLTDSADGDCSAVKMTTCADVPDPVVFAAELSSASDSKAITSMQAADASDGVGSSSVPRDSEAIARVDSDDSRASHMPKEG